MAPRLLPLLVLLAITGSLYAQPDCSGTETLEPLDTWQMVSGSYSTDGSMIYEVTMDLGVNYVFKTGCGDGAIADHNTIIDWMAWDCTVINSNDDGCENGRSLLSFNSFFSDGMVLWIRVRGSQGQGGSFTMAYRSIGGVPGQCNDCPSYDVQLAPSSQWQTASGDYGDDGCKVYRIFTTPGLEYEFKTGCGDGAIADHDTQLEVFRNGCINVTSDDNGCELGRSRVLWTAASSGSSINYIRVSSASGTAGNFTLAYRRIGGNGSVCSGCPTHDISGTPGQNWATSASSYLSGGCQVYRFSVTEGYQYTFKTGCGNGASADHDTLLELFDATCSLLATDDNGCSDGSAIIQHVATYTGFQYLKVSGVDGAAGFYTLAYRRSGTCITCPAYDLEISPTMDWQTASGSYYNDGCWMYKVNVTEEHTYVFESAQGHGGTADHSTVLQAYQEDCAPVVSPPWVWVEQPDRLFHRAATSGVVYVRVSGWLGAFGAHTLAYREVGASSDLCADAIPITLSGDATVELSGTLQDATSDADFAPTSPWQELPMKWYAFDIVDPCYSLIVSYCGQDPAWSNTLNVLTTTCPGDPVLSGTTPFQICTDGNASYWFEGIMPGLYYLPLLYDPVNSLDGNYVITVSCSNMIIDGVQEDQGRHWSVYPNPGNDGFWLHTSLSTSSQAQFRVYDMLGGLVQRGPLSATSTRIDMDAVSAGIYVVHVQEGNGLSSFKWVKE